MSLVFLGLGEVETSLWRRRSMGPVAYTSTRPSSVPEQCPLRVAWAPPRGWLPWAQLDARPCLTHRLPATGGHSQVPEQLSEQPGAGLELVLVCWWVGLCPTIKALWSVWRWSEVWPGDGFPYHDNAHIHIKMLWKLLSRNTTSLRRLLTRWNWLRFPFERLLLRAPCHAGICDLWRRGFQSEFRDEAWPLGAFCIAKFYLSIIEVEIASDRHQRGQKECPLASF